MLTKYDVCNVLLNPFPVILAPFCRLDRTSRRVVNFLGAVCDYYTRYMKFHEGPFCSKYNRQMSLFTTMNDTHSDCIR